MSQPHYRLTYFDARGLAEPIRMIFAVAGVEYEDVRIPLIKFTEENIEKLRETYPMSLPTLEIDGETYSHTFAIIWYLAKKYGLTAENEYDNFRTHECCDDFRNFFAKWKPILYEGAPQAQKDELKKKLLEEDTIQIMSKYNEILVKNNANGSPWLYGNKMTWNDIALAHFLHNFKVSLAYVDLTEGFPAMKQFCNHVLSQPKIKEWIEKRPNTIY